MFIYLKQGYFNCISYFTKKDSNIWIFGAVRGEKYMDNSKYLFEYINQNTDINAIWLSNNPDVIDSINKKAYKAYSIHSKKGIYYAMHAKVAIITHRGVNEDADLPFYCFSKETKIVQLWHGIALKKIAFDDKIDGFTQNESDIFYKLKQKIKLLFFPFTNYVNNPSLLLALSKESEDIFSKAFRVDKKNIKITGYPRNDLLFKSKEKHSLKIKKIIYMPTFRNKTNLDFDIVILNEFLLKKDLKFYIKIHPFDKLPNSILDKLSESQNIFIIKNDDIYEVLTDFDILITDYSSIYFDYLLLDRPIIFAPFDKNSYLKNEREFYYNYDDITPGPQAKNWKELMQHIDNYIENSNLFFEERMLIKNKFHKYQDSNSSKRVVESIRHLI